MKAHYGCPVQATFNVLSGKWKVQAVWHLSFGPLRFLALRRTPQSSAGRQRQGSRRPAPRIRKRWRRNQEGSTFIAAEGYLFAQPLGPNLDPAARRSLRLGLQTIWHQAQSASKSSAGENIIFLNGRALPRSCPAPSLSFRQRPSLPISAFHAVQRICW